MTEMYIDVPQSCIMTEMVCHVHTHTYNTHIQHTRTYRAPSLADQRHVGFFVTDSSSQTDQSDIVDVKRVTHVIETLVQVRRTCMCINMPDIHVHVL